MFGAVDEGGIMELIIGEVVGVVCVSCRGSEEEDREVVIVEMLVVTVFVVWVLTVGAKVRGRTAGRGG